MNALCKVLESEECVHANVDREVTIASPMQRVVGNPSRHTARRCCSTFQSSTD